MTCAYCGQHELAARHGALWVRPDWDGQGPFPFVAPGTYPPGWPTHTLSDDEVERVERCVQVMHERARGRRDPWRLPPNLERRRRGLQGEMAVAVLTGYPFRCDLAGFGKPDVGPYQVRTTDGWPYLAVNSTDLAGPRTPCILVFQDKVSTRRFTIRGLLPEAGRALDWPAEGERGPGKAEYKVPLNALVNPWAIPELSPKA